MITAVGLIIETIPALNSLAIGGRLLHCVAAWKCITDNLWVRNTVRFGYKMPFRSKPYQTKVPGNPKVSPEATEVLNSEAKGLLDKKAIKEAVHEQGEFISSYFAVPKPRSTKFRPIINLKYFNKNLKHYKFRMETFSQVRDWLQPGAFLIGIDLKDQFLSCPMNKKFHKYLRFQWFGKLFEWRVLPFGLKCSPRVVTKLLKPIMRFLRTKWGVNITVYMDDMLLQAPTKELAYFHAQLTILLLLCLGWEVNWEKSSVIPSQTITHLGFEINTKSMTATCPTKKIERLVNDAKTILQAGQMTVHDGEKILGLMESMRPVTPLGAFHYRSLQKQLLIAKRPKRNPSKMIELSKESLNNLVWWVKPTGFLSNCTASLREPQPNVHIWSDASMSGCGAHDSLGNYFQRDWSETEKSLHINVLELIAAKEAIARFATPGQIIRLHLDNKVACAYIAKQGGTRSNDLSWEACQLWELIQEKQATLITPHWISTKDNASADFLTRHKLSTWEFKLNADIFIQIVSFFRVLPTLDAFASKETAQLKRYMSWKPDQNAVGRDCMLHKWDQTTYLFPPVPMIPKVLNKVQEEGITAILVCPWWPSSLWFLQVQSLLLAPPYPLPPFKEILIPEEGELKVYLEPLVAVLISGRV